MKVPRVSDVPADVSPDGFESKIVKRYERTSRQTQGLFRKLYMEGLSTGDFEPVFQELVGDTAALSPNAIVRLKQRWEEEYRVWCSRMLNEYRYTAPECSRSRPTSRTGDMILSGGIRPALTSSCTSRDRLGLSVGRAGEYSAAWIWDFCCLRNV